MYLADPHPPQRKKEDINSAQYNYNVMVYDTAGLPLTLTDHFIYILFHAIRKSMMPPLPLPRLKK